MFGAGLLNSLVFFFTFVFCFFVVFLGFHMYSDLFSLQVCVVNCFDQNCEFF